MATAKIICDSISETGVRITTLELEFERYILPQFNTHRMFSRNAQSSRALPTQKLIDELKNSELHPQFMKNKSGMQASEELNKEDFFAAFRCWENAKHDALRWAMNLRSLNVHKQFVNRLLEPFNTIKVVVTATEWQNFFNLRLHHDAQPEIQALAQAMKTAMDESTPKLLRVGEWHLPYITEFDLFNTTDDEFEELPKISAARCARVSYLNHDNTDPNIEKDLELSSKLLTDKHCSPFEHQAKPVDYVEFEKTGFDFDEFDGITHIDKKGNVWSANYRGWIQYRALIH